MKLICTSIVQILKEHKENISRIWFIAKAHFKKQTSVTTLGVGWVFVHDIIYFATFALFRYMLSGGRDIAGMNIIMYLFSGIVPWFFMNDVLNLGTKCFVSNKSIFSSMSFPTSIIPTYETLSILLKRIISFVLLMIITIVIGYIKFFNVFLFIYYYISMVLLSLSLNMFISPLVAISKDLDQIYRAVLRILFFLIPIIWSFELIESINPAITIFIKLNPLVYILIGFRDAFYYGNLPDLLYSIYFWLFVIICFAFACVLQFKIRKYYDDWI